LMTHSIIQDNRYLTLATCSNNEVWAAPIAYVYNSVKKEFYFYSSTQSKHAQHIENNSNVVVTIFDSTAPSETAEGLQIKAQAGMVSDQELQGVMDLYFEQSFPDEKERAEWQRPIEYFIDEAPQRFYKIVSVQGFVNANKDMIDYREKVDL